MGTIQGKRTRGLEKLLVLKLTFLPCFTTFRKTIYEFPVTKRSQILLPGRSRQIIGEDKRSRAARSAVFRDYLQNGGRRFKLD